MKNPEWERDVTQSVILIIDDNTNSLGVVIGYLEELGFGIVSAINGELGLKRARLLKPNLILLDVRMPGWDGFETCRRLKADEETREIPVIFMTALTDPEDTVKAFALGAVDYITKPLHQEEVTARVITHLRVRGLTQRLQQQAIELEKKSAEATKEKRIAETANLAKSEFLANMGHELRTPMNAILGFAQLMRRDPELTPKQRENLGIIHRSGEHLLRLINDVLDMSKIEAGRTTLELGSFDLWDTLKHLEEMMRVRAERKGLQFTVTRASNVPQYISTDESRLRQVLMNLLGNAVKFTEEGGVTLRVTRERGDHGRDTSGQRHPVVGIRFEIEDTGIGIAEEDVDSLFDAFVQIRRVGATTEGTGLGLAISRKCVQLMGGEIHVERDVEKGAVFSFTIQGPLVEHATIDTRHTSIQRRVIGLAPNQPAYRILIAEDHADSRILLAQLLRAADFTVDEATNGREAIEQYHHWQPQLILMDMRMPIMTGYKATRSIRNAEEQKNRSAEGTSTPLSSQEGKHLALSTRQSSIHTPIIALMASVLEEEKSRIFSAGCDAVVRKPLREGELFDVIRQYLGARYVYEEPEQGRNGTALQQPSLENIMIPEVLAALPLDVLSSLEQAAAQGHVRRVDQAVEAIRPHNIAVANALAALAKEFNYQKILKMIQNT